MPNRPSSSRFTTTLRELVWVVTVAAVALGWMVDRYRISERHEQTEAAFVSKLNEQHAMRAKQEQDIATLLNEAADARRRVRQNASK